VSVLINKIFIHSFVVDCGALRGQRRSADRRRAGPGVGGRAEGARGPATASRRLPGAGDQHPELDRCATYGPITIAFRARFEYDSSTIRARFEHDTTSYEELCAFEQ